MIAKYLQRPIQEKVRFWTSMAKKGKIRTWERMVPGGARGLQNRWRVSFDALGGSTPLAPAVPQHPADDKSACLSPA